MASATQAGGTLALAAQLWAGVAGPGHVVLLYSLPSDTRAVLLCLGMLINQEGSCLTKQLGRPHPIVKCLGLSPSSCPQAPRQQQALAQVAEPFTHTYTRREGVTAVLLFQSLPLK